MSGDYNPADVLDVVYSHHDSVASSTGTMDRSRGFSMVVQRPVESKLLQRLASRVLYSKAYTGLYVAAIAGNVFLFAWAVAHHRLYKKVNHSELWFVALDVLMSLVFGLEVCTRLAASGVSRFFQSCLNVVDFVVMVLVVAGSLLYFVSPELAVFGSGVLFVRYVLQLTRIICMVRFHRRRQNVLDASNETVDIFSEDPYSHASSQAGSNYSELESRLDDL